MQFGSWAFGPVFFYTMQGFQGIETAANTPTKNKVWYMFMSPIMNITETRGGNHHVCQPGSGDV